MKQVCVIGLGYVGLPLAQRAAQVGYEIVGVDTNPDVVARLLKNEVCFSQISGSYSQVNASDIFLVCVPTPINTDKTPDLTYINSALTELGKHLTKNCLVSIESTLYPGYCDTIGRDILESTSGLNIGEDFYLVHCPERINPGDDEWTIANIPRVIAAGDPLSLEKGVHFYQTITAGEVYPLRNFAEAEASKMVENAFRDINIAFVNELAKSFDGTNIDVMNVIKASATKPFGYMPFYPGLGVGGHCIPIDPEYLISAARERGFEHEILKLARIVNDGMVDYVVDKLDRLIAHLNIPRPEILILGLTYKPNVDDVRESQAVRLMELLKSEGRRVAAYDPHISLSSKDLDWYLSRATVVILATPHDSFDGLAVKLNSHPDIKLIIDTANKLDPQSIKLAHYCGIGR